MHLPARAYVPSPRRQCAQGLPMPPAHARATHTTHMTCVTRATRASVHACVTPPCAPRASMHAQVCPAHYRAPRTCMPDTRQSAVWRAAGAHAHNGSACHFWYTCHRFTTTGLGVRGSKRPSILTLKWDTHHLSLIYNTGLSTVPRRIHTDLHSDSDGPEDTDKPPNGRPYTISDRWQSKLFKKVMALPQLPKASCSMGKEKRKKEKGKEGRKEGRKRKKKERERERPAYNGLLSAPCFLALLCLLNPSGILTSRGQHLMLSLLQAGSRAEKE
ncbi:hypothetical protein L345_05570, partial [Ophiophagus hannah]